MIRLNVLLLSNPMLYFGLFLGMGALFAYLQFRKKAKAVRIIFCIGTLALFIQLVMFWITMASKDPL